jgi:hypothetical protein
MEEVRVVVCVRACGLRTGFFGGLTLPTRGEREFHQMKMRMLLVLGAALALTIGVATATANGEPKNELPFTRKLGS